MKNKRLLLLIVIAIFPLIIGAAYAYFQNSGSTGTNTSVKG